MFSTLQKLLHKTPSSGTNRRDYIEHLIEEYYTTANVEAQEQVTANLANFAYDPLNWEYIKSFSGLDLFLELIASPNETLQLHGIAAFCNICLDPDAAAYIVRFPAVTTIAGLLMSTENPEIFVNCVTIFHQLLGTNAVIDKYQLTEPAIIKTVISWKESSTDPKLLNICNLFLKDHCSRTEVLELQSEKCSTSGQDASTVPQKKN